MHNISSQLNMDTSTDMEKRFQIWDFVIFGGMLSVSGFIGIYYGFIRKGKNSTQEFLMGGRQMGSFPVSLSLLASFMSAITLLGFPAEMYIFNTMNWINAASFFLVIPVASHIYLPIFYRLELTSAFEYLERRFNKTIRRCGSLVFILQMTMYMAIVLYAPALALSHVTGLDLWGSVIAIGVVCTFYTTVGGMKAVMWTDAFQTFIMFGAMLTVIIKGAMDVGGFQKVWEISLEGDRIQFNDFSPDPRVRHSFWSLTIGGFFTWLAIYGVNQAQVQRYLTTPTMGIAQRALWWNLPGLVCLLSICSYGGLVIYAKYWNCDPLTTGQIKTSDQLMPLFVMDTLGFLPGLPGLFVAGIFSGALSTISSGMNSLAAVTLEDFVRTCFPKMTEKTATLVSKSLAMFYGILCIALVAVAKQMGNVLQAALSIFGIVGGPLLGVFTLGMFVPYANSLGAGIGLLVSFALSFWIGIGAQVYKPYIPLPYGNVSTAGCSFNFTLNNNTDSDMAPDVLEIYKISYLWVSAIACLTVVVVGTIVSFLSGKQDPSELDPLVISPIVKKISCCFHNTSRKDANGIPEGHHTSVYTINKVKIHESNGKETIMKEKDGFDNAAYLKNEQPNHNPVLQSNGEYTTSL